MALQSQKVSGSYASPMGKSKESVTLLQALQELTEAGFHPDVLSFQCYMESFPLVFFCLSFCCSLTFISQLVFLPLNSLHVQKVLDENIFFVCMFTLPGIIFL